nr:PREDICTED: uncharacterized protein LOC109455821 isoform X3 [Rhinolophus sinicus]
MHAMVHGGVGLWAATAASPSVLLVPRTVGGSSRAPTVGFKALLHKAPGSTVCSGWECDQDLWGCWGCMESRLLVSGFPICPRVLTACFPSSASCQASWVCFTDQATDLRRRGGAASWKDRGRRDTADQPRGSRAAPPLVLKAESSSNPAPCLPAREAFCPMNFLLNGQRNADLNTQNGKGLQTKTFLRRKVGRQALSSNRSLLSGSLEGIVGVRRSGWKPGPDFSTGAKLLWASFFSLVKQGAVQEGKEKNNRESILLQTEPRAKHSFLRMKNPLPHPVGAHKSRMKTGCLEVEKKSYEHEDKSHLLKMVQQKDRGALVLGGILELHTNPGLLTSTFPVT